MVTRIMISLRKAAASQEGGWSLGELPENCSDLRGMEFVYPRTAGTEDAALHSVHLESQTAIR